MSCQMCRFLKQLPAELISHCSLAAEPTLASETKKLWWEKQGSTKAKISQSEICSGTAD